MLNLGWKRLRFRIENDFLVLDRFPRHITLRYGKIPNRIFIRQCYKDIYNLVTSQMLDEEEIQPAFLFTGVPGIGKSMFLLYFLCRFLHDDRFPDKRFALEFERGEYLYFLPTVVPDNYDLQILQEYDFPIENVLVLSDISLPLEPKTRGKWILLFCSPNPKRYNGIMKNLPHFNYILSVWSYDELKSMKKDDDESWLPMYAKCGGIARNVLCNPNQYKEIIESLEKKLYFVGHTVVDNFMNRNFGAVNAETSYSLVHFNPPRTDKGKYIYQSVRCEYTFASMYVFQKLMADFKKSKLREVVNWFNSRDDLVLQKYGGSFARDLFVWLCLFYIPLSGRKILCEPLNNEQSPLGNFVLPEMELLSSPWVKEGNLKPMVLYVPTASNMQLGDAFCAMDINGMKVLLVFQMTVPEAHPVKANDLVKITKAFPVATRMGFQRKIIVFVMPFQGKLRHWQPLRTRKGKVFRDLGTQNFEQWTYRYYLVMP